MHDPCVVFIRIPRVNHHVIPPSQHVLLHIGVRIMMRTQHICSHREVYMHPDQDTVGGRGAEEYRSRHGWRLWSRGVQEWVETESTQIVKGIHGVKSVRKVQVRKLGGCTGENDV